MAKKLNFSGSKPLNQQSNMPQIVDALSDWQDPITLGVVTQTWSEGDKVETVSQITFTGVIQPLSPKQLSFKPEGERAWKWLQIHDYTGELNLKTDDRIYIDSDKYKVMAVNDYTRNNYIEYHVVRDYE